MRLLPLTSLLCLAVTGCGGGEPPFRSGCSVRIQEGSETYVDVGFTSRHVERFGTARVLTCAADAGKDGSATVSTWEVTGFDSRHVIAVREKGLPTRVFFAEDLSETRRQQILATKLLNAGTG